jgi:hypothetical protein
VTRIVLPAFAAFVFVVGWAASAAGSALEPDEGALSPLDPSWEWHEGDRRNPFEFASAAEPDRGDDDENKKKPPPPPPPPRGNPAEIAEHAIDLARRSLDQGLFERAEEAAAEALDAIAEGGGRDPEALGRLERLGLVERLGRLRLTARRLRLRREAEQEFASLRIEIGGVVWDERDPVALVNGRVVRAGDVVEGVRVERIGPEEIVFALKGFLMRRRFWR